ncbi:MAG: TIGR01777 family oxidoreductase [Polyangiaceae bacterium]
MRVLVTGGTGFVGSALVRALARRGDRVTVLTRNPNKARNGLPRGVRAAAWHPQKAGPWQDELGVVDAVVHLAGDPVAQRWTEATKKSIKASRVESTKLIVDAIAKADKKPAVMVSASATGYYGVSRKGRLVEDSDPGKGFLPEVCIGWEEEAKRAEEHGVRTVQLRLGVVLGPDGGALDKMVAPMRLFVNGPIGKGDNAMSWIHRDDVVGMILWALDDEGKEGAYNCTSPFSTTGKELAKTMGSVLGRPAVPAPEAAVRMVMGEAVDVLVGSLDVYPERAVDQGYEYHYARLTPALESSLMADE